MPALTDSENMTKSIGWLLADSQSANDQQLADRWPTIYFGNCSPLLPIHSWTPSPCPSFEFGKGAQVSSVEQWLVIFSFRQVDSNKKWRMEDWTNYCISYLDQIVHKGSLVNFAGFCKWLDKILQSSQIRTFVLQSLVDLWRYFY